MDISFIIVNYKTPTLTLQCIQSIIQFTNKQLYEIIVVDNHSNDGSVEIIAKKYPSVILIASDVNLGFGKANNLASTIAKGKYFFLLNSDTYLLDDAGGQFWNFMELKENLGVACCGGDLFDFDGKQQVSYGNFPSIFEAFSILGFYMLYKQFFKRRVASGVYNYDEVIKKVDYLCGADMFIRGHIFKELNGFDNDFFLYYEETELSFRIQNMGFTSVLIPSIKIVHLEGASQTHENDTINYAKIERYYKSRSLYFNKTHGNMYSSSVKLLDCVKEIILFLIKSKGNIFKVLKIVIKS
jgi:GT2 family glycosyltransferase